MLWKYFTILILYYQNIFTSDYRPICYNVYGTKQNLKLWQSTKLNFHFDLLRMYPAQIEQPIDRRERDDIIHLYYLQKTETECIDYLEFGMKSNKTNINATVAIYLGFYEDKGYVFDYFLFEFTNGYNSRKIKLKSHNEWFAIEVMTVHRPTVFHPNLTPVNFWKRGPPLNKGENLCLKFFKLGDGYIDKLYLPFESSKPYRYRSVLFNLYNENNINIAFTEEPAEISVCKEDIFNPFYINLQKSTSAVNATLTLEIEEDKILKASFKFCPDNCQIHQKDLSNWYPEVYIFKSTTAQEALKTKSDNSIFLFKTEKKRTECRLEGKRCFFEQFISDQTVMKNNSEFFSKLPEDPNIWIVKAMNDTNMDECSKEYARRLKEKNKG